MQVWELTGFAAMVSSVPIVCVGYATRNKTPNIYNYQCMKKELDVRYTVQWERTA